MVVLSLFLQARGSFYLKELRSKPAERDETIKQTYFLFSNGEAGLTLETHLSSFQNQGYTDSHCIFSYDSVTRESKPDGTQGVHNLCNGFTQVKHFVKL